MRLHRSNVLLRCQPRWWFIDLYTMYWKSCRDWSRCLGDKEIVVDYFFRCEQSMDLDVLNQLPVVHATRQQ